VKFVSPEAKLTFIVGLAPSAAAIVTCLLVPAKVPYDPDAKQIVCPADADDSAEAKDDGVADRSQVDAAVAEPPAPIETPTTPRAPARQMPTRRARAAGELVDGRERATAQSD
jgi:hypothetical protein